MQTAIFTAATTLEKPQGPVLSGLCGKHMKWPQAPCHFSLTSQTGSMGQKTGP